MRHSTPGARHTRSAAQPASSNARSCLDRSSNGRLSRLSELDREQLYEIFCITSPPFVALLLKMMAYTESCGKGVFSLAGPESRRDSFRLDALYKPEQVLEPLAGLLETRQANFHNGTSKAESV